MSQQPSSEQLPPAQSQGSQQAQSRSQKRHRRSRTMSKEVLIALIGAITTIAATIITGILGPALLKTGSGQTTPTPVTFTSPGPTFSPTLTPIDPQKLYDQITASTPTLHDPLSSNSLNDWDEEHPPTYSCTFMKGAYHASLQVKPDYVECPAYSTTNFSDFTYQIQMTIARGDNGGILFRFDDSNEKGYSFTIDQYGAYDLQLWRGKGKRENLLNGSSSVIKTGLNQTNLIAIVADGSNIYLYMNHHYLNRASDTTYQSGEIGVLAENSTSSSTEVVFSSAQVWKLESAR
ncbi:MAG TPA: hypothetical protein VEL31_27165 [Ktedonobacteraceae bacterium]|nr:hypothetical protein [Ktedonobacteraceae bacterium]